MILGSLVIAAQLAACAPNVNSRTMAAIVRVESGGDPLAIGDNTTRVSYHPKNRRDAEAIARTLLSLRHSLDLGLAQVNNRNLEHFGIGVHAAFDPCTNLQAGARILALAYSQAVRRFGRGREALRHAIGMYNTGSLDAGFEYAHRVLAIAGLEPNVVRTSPPVSIKHRAATSALMVAVVVQSKRREPHRVTPATAPILVAPISKAVLVLQ